MGKDCLCLARLCVMKKKKNKSSAIAAYILANLEEAERLTISSLAEKTETSYATVCRFLKDLGVSGIKEFKRLIGKEIERNKQIEVKIDNYSLEGEQGFESISKRVCDFSSSVVASCADSMRESSIAAVIRAVKKAGSICFVGLGTSAVTAQYAYTKFFRLNLNCSFDTDIIISKMKASVMKRGDVLFVISSSGRTKPVLEAAKTAKANGATVISVCDFVHSPLFAVSDIYIHTTLRDSNKYLDMDFPLIQGQVTIIDVIYSCLCREMKNSAAFSVKKTTEAVSVYKSV